MTSHLVIFVTAIEDDIIDNIVDNHIIIIYIRSYIWTVIVKSYSFSKLKNK